MQTKPHDGGAGAYGNGQHMYLYPTVTRPATRGQREKPEKSEGVKDNYNDNLHIRTRKGQSEAQVKRSGCETYGSKESVLNRLISTLYGWF